MCKIADETILEIKGVTYVYDGERLPIWKSLSCSFRKGEIHAVSGPSGCGKSSLLYLINGLIPHMYAGSLEGEILLEGRDITRLEPRYRCEEIGLVMQNAESQFCTFTVEEELAFGMENLGLPREEMAYRIKEILNKIDMEGYEEVDLNSLSGGQKQKIAIASVLVTEPKILLLDEPTANLDPISRKQIFDLIVNISKEKNITVIIVEHNIQEIIKEVHHLILLDREGNIKSDFRTDLAEVAVLQTENTESFSTGGAVKNQCRDEPVIRICNVNFAYPLEGKKKEKGKKIFSGLSFDIYKGDLLAILGENGVGKSTLMKLLFKINRPDGGEITVYGKSLDKIKTKDLYRQMGLVFQNPESQFITNTVWDEMMFSLRRTALSKEEKEEKADRMLRRFYLEAYKEKSPFILSQGQKRRLSVAGMLLTEQKILFLDEPTFGQDFENRHELMRDMQKLVEAGVTVVMITHDLSLVKQYASRIVRIENGIAADDMTVVDYFSKFKEK